MVITGHVITEKVFGHPGGTCLASPWELTRHYIKLLRHVHEGREKKGLSAAIYTQLSDIEAECNGFVTCDRAVVKMDISEVAAANPVSVDVLSRRGPPICGQSSAREAPVTATTSPAVRTPTRTFLKPTFAGGTGRVPSMCSLPC